MDLAIHGATFAVGSGLGLLCAYAFDIRPAGVRRQLFGPRPFEAELEFPVFETVKVFNGPSHEHVRFGMPLEALQKKFVQVVGVKRTKPIQEPGKQHLHTLLESHEFRQDQSPRPSDFGQVLDAAKAHEQAEDAWDYAQALLISSSLRLGSIFLILGLLQLNSCIRWFINSLVELKQTAIQQDEKIAAQNDIIARQNEQIAAQSRTIATLDQNLERRDERFNEHIDAQRQTITALDVRLTSHGDAVDSQNERINKQDRTTAIQEENITSQNQTIVRLQELIETLSEKSEHEEAAVDDAEHNSSLLEALNKLEQLQTETAQLKEHMDAIFNAHIPALEASQTASADRLQFLESSQQIKDGHRRRFAFTLWTTFLPSHQMNENWRTSKQSIVPWEENINSPNYKRPITADDFSPDDLDRLAPAFFGQLIRILFQQSGAIDMFSRVQQPSRRY